MNFPGPGGYDSHKIFIKNINGPRCKFGKDTRETVKLTGDPGPGAYEYREVYNSTVKKAPAVDQFYLVLYGHQVKREQ